MFFINFDIDYEDEEDEEEKDFSKLTHHGKVEEDLIDPNFCGHFKALLTNPVFVFVTLSLCAVFFVVTGI